MERVAEGEISLFLKSDVIFIVMVRSDVGRIPLSGTEVVRR